MSTMMLEEKFIQWYFNAVYNPVYDFTTARFSRYRLLQEKCISKLSFNDTQNVLCIGVGTGNEIIRILHEDPSTEITAVDFSDKALIRAQQKAAVFGKEVSIHRMDVRQLEFEKDTFDKVLCIHVMDFLTETGSATSEIVRVVKNCSEFVITFPSKNEGPGLGKALFRDSIEEDRSRGRNWFVSYIAACCKLLMGFVYLPLYIRSGKNVYSRKQIEASFDIFGDTLKIDIEEETVYRDFIVHGLKVK